MILTESIKSAFETVFTLEEQKTQLESSLKKAKATIRKALEEAGEKSIKDGPYYALIADATRSTLVTEEVEKLLGYKIPESCYKKTPYTTFTVKKQEVL